MPLGPLDEPLNHTRTNNTKGKQEEWKRNEKMSLVDIISILKEATVKIQYSIINLIILQYKTNIHLGHTLMHEAV